MHRRKNLGQRYCLESNEDENFLKMSFGDRYGGGRGGGYGRSGGGGGGYSGGSYQVRDGDNEYLERSQKVTSNIYAINQNVAELQRFTGFIGTSRDVPEMRERMHQVQEQTRGIIRDTSQALKKLSHVDGGDQREIRDRRMQQEKLSQDFKSVLQKFQTASQVAVSKERDTVSRERAQSQSRGFGGGGGGGGDGDFGGGYNSAYGGDSERDRLIADERRAQMEHMDNQIDYSSSLIVEREEAIKEIEATMVEVNDIYRDLSTLVVEQGAQLDNIEANMSSADASVESGVQQLGTASRYQKKARNKMCIFLIVVSIVLAIIVVVVLQEEKKNKKN